MTWDEFKAEVDKQLSEEGIDGSVQVDYIAVSPTDGHEFVVNVYADNSGFWMNDGSWHD